MDFQDQIRSSSEPSGEPAPQARRRFGCVGCLLFFLIGSFLLCGGLCGGGYYALFHSSWPLVQIEKALESTGDVQVEGLTGSVSSGFHADRVRFRSIGDQWSELDQVDFAFNGLIDVSQNQRLLVERVSVGGGEIHVRELPDFRDWQASAAQPDSGSPPPANPPTEPGSEFSAEMQALKEIRVDLLQLSDLKLVSKLTGVEFNINEISIKDFHFLDGKVLSLGDIIVAADHIDFEAMEAGAYFADRPGVQVARKFTGVVHATIHENVLEDIPFQIDVGFVSDARLRVRAQLFGGRFTFAMDEAGRLEAALQDFTLTDFVRWDQGPLPGHVTGRITSEIDPSAPGTQVVTIEPGAMFRFGEREFAVETGEMRIAHDADVTPPLVARCSTAEPEIVCRIYGLQGEPYWTMVVESGQQRGTTELLADVLYGEPLAALNDEQQQAIQRLQDAAEKMSTHGEQEVRSAPTQAN